MLEHTSRLDVVTSSHAPVCVATLRRLSFFVKTPSASLGGGLIKPCFQVVASFTFRQPVDLPSLQKTVFDRHRRSLPSAIKSLECL